MKLRKNATTPKSCQITIDDEYCLGGNKGAGWAKNDELAVRVVKKKYGSILEIRRIEDIMNFMTKNE